MEIKNRFESYIRYLPNGCWYWWGGSQGDYGCFSFEGKPILAHRFSYYLYRDFKLNSKEQINHNCSNKKCVNPDHLKIGDAFSNKQDEINSGSYRNHNKEKTHCPQGHEYNEKNTYYAYSKGVRSRYCKICNRKSERLKRRKRK